MLPEPMKQPEPPLEELDATTTTPDDEVPEEDVEAGEALKLMMV